MGDYNDLRRAASQGCEEADLYKDKPATQVARPEQQSKLIVRAYIQGKSTSLHVGGQRIVFPTHLKDLVVAAIINAALKGDG